MGDCHARFWEIVPREASAKVLRNYIGDEGRPLVTVLQEMVTNQCMLLCLRDKVVSDTPKGDVNRQVTIQEMTARELLMKHRKLFRRCQNRVFSVRPGINPEGTCLRSGWHPVQR